MSRQFSILLQVALLSPLVLPASQSWAGDSLSADKILGRSEFPAICYGGYRGQSRDDVPTVKKIRDDLQILSAMGVKIVRTYNTQQYAHAARLLEAIEQLRSAQPGFEMYVMLGAWIDCEDAWAGQPNHEAESEENNRAEIDAAVSLAKQHPDIVKVIAVGNEAMVHWAASYFVRPNVILKWVRHLQQLKSRGEISEKIWITSSDNFASWGGGDDSYHNEDLNKLIDAVDYVSMHTYPFHDSHYSSDYWTAPADEASASPVERARAAMQRAADYAKSQYRDTAAYVRKISPGKPVHIGETGWASHSNSLYGANGSQAADEFKAGLFYSLMRDWTRKNGISCFYFEAFDEPWKDAANPEGSENHFGQITVDGHLKYAMWSLADQGVFRGLTRDGNPLEKTFGGSLEKLSASVSPVPVKGVEAAGLGPMNEDRATGEVVTEQQLIVFHASQTVSTTNRATHPSSAVKLNVWDGTCNAAVIEASIVSVSPGAGAWWGCGLELQADGQGENLSEFANGTLHFDIRSETESAFEVGFQTGVYAKGNQTNNSVSFNGESAVRTTSDWKSHSVPIAELNDNADLKNVTTLFYLRGDARNDEKPIEIRRVFYAK